MKSRFSVVVFVGFSVSVYFNKEKSNHRHEKKKKKGGEVIVEYY